jgi:hypothetical protein
MKNLSIKKSFATEIIATAIVFFLLFVSASLSAKGLPKTGNTKKDTTASVAKKEAKKVLSAEATEFYNSIEEFYQATYVKSKKEIITNDSERIVVYNQLGETVSDKKAKDTTLPKGATKLFTEGKVVYYLVF